MPQIPEKSADRYGLPWDHQTSNGETQARVGRLMGLARALRADAEAVQAALSLAERRFQATFLHAPVGIAHVGMDGSFLMANPRFSQITGYSTDELMRTGFQEITHPDDLDADVAQLARLHAGEFQRYTMEKRYIRPDGSIVWINLTVAMVRDDTGHPEFYVAVIEDMSDMRQAYYDSAHDPLTGLLNRRGFVEHAERVLGRAAHDAQPVSLVYLDLDGFKALNDRCGHSAGDRCLVDIARMMEAMVRPADAIGRMGGDEFVLLFSGLSGRKTANAVERFRQALTQMSIVEGQRISGSFGLVTVVPNAGMSLENMIGRADEAMLQAKRGGRNQVAVASSA